MPFLDSRLNFAQRLLHDRICLESIRVQRLDVLGVVRVVNVAHRKEVSVRFTLDRWTSYRDLAAKFVDDVGSTSPKHFSDRFCFFLRVPCTQPHHSLVELALRYRVDGQEFWDNNSGVNYQLFCTTRDGDGRATAVPVR